jgi:ferredoxin
MKVDVKPGRCVGHTLCNATAPEVFELDDDGYVAIGKDTVIPAELEPLALAGVAACPERALVVPND